MLSLPANPPPTSRRSCRSALPFTPGHLFASFLTQSPMSFPLSYSTPLIPTTISLNISLLLSSCLSLHLHASLFSFLSYNLHFPQPLVIIIPSFLLSHSLHVYISFPKVPFKPFTVLSYVILFPFLYISQFLPYFSLPLITPNLSFLLVSIPSPYQPYFYFFLQSFLLFAIFDLFLTSPMQPPSPTSTLARLRGTRGEPGDPDVRTREGNVGGGRGRGRGGINAGVRRR